MPWLIFIQHIGPHIIAHSTRVSWQCIITALCFIDCLDYLEKSNHQTLTDSCSAGTYRDSSMTMCQECPDNKISGVSAGLCTACSQGSLANKHHTKCGERFESLSFINCIFTLRMALSQSKNDFVLLPGIEFDDSVS